MYTKCCERSPSTHIHTPRTTNTQFSAHQQFVSNAADSNTSPCTLGQWISQLHCQYIPATGVIMYQQVRWNPQISQQKCNVLCTAICWGGGRETKWQTGIYTYKYFNKYI